MQKLRKSSCVLLIVLSIFILFGCNNKNDAYNFKKEYESLNNKKDSNGKIIREIKIGRNNPFIYKTADDIIELINKKETFIVYFCFASCPWCRSILPTFIEALKDNGIETVYYVDIKDIRDEYELDENNKPILTKEASEGYDRLLELFDSNLSDYTIKDVKIGKKRIYAPNIVSIIYGKVISIETGISSLQTDGYMELTDEMIDETYGIFDDLIRPVSEVLNSCDINTGC